MAARLHGSEDFGVECGGVDLGSAQPQTQLCAHAKMVHAVFLEP